MKRARWLVEAWFSPRVHQVFLVSSSVRRSYKKNEKISKYRKEWGKEEEMGNSFCMAFELTSMDRALQMIYQSVKFIQKKKKYSFFFFF